MAHAKPLVDYNEVEQAVLARFGHSDFDYFRLLGRNLPVLEQRTLTDKGIFYTAGGLPRKERELVAAVTSKVNGCIFCASVHARKASQLSKQTEDIQRLLDADPVMNWARGSRRAGRRLSILPPASPLPRRWQMRMTWRT